MRKVYHVLVLLPMLMMGTSHALQAQVPRTMSVQGVLTDGSGDPAPQGLKIFIFKIFDQEVGGTEIWPAGAGEQHTLLTDARGIWNAEIGSLLDLPPIVFGDSSRWLQVTVDDGINPPETLPRVRLNSGPFSVHAAVSDQAAAIGGNTMDDLSDQFIDEAGDTTGGVLTINAPRKNTVGSSVRVNNVNDGNAPVGVLFNTIAIAGNAASDGSETKVGVLGYSGGSDGVTAGTIGQGEGSGPVNMGIYGVINDLGAEENYSGLFWGGDLRVRDPATPGDSSVRLPDNAITHPEILDEAGITHSGISGNVGITGSTSMKDVVTTTIDIPAAGYIIVDAFATTWYHSTTLSNRMYFQIDETAGGSHIVGIYADQGLVKPPSTDMVVMTTSTRRIFYKSSPGSYTFRLEAKDFTGNGSKGFFNPRITAMFMPTSYGTVNWIATNDDVSDFESVRTLTGEETGTGQPTGETAYEVDLRDLELRAARARAAAEEAEREFLEAHLRQGNLPVARRAGEEQ